MYMVKEFLESLVSPKTKKSYRHGIEKFEGFYSKQAKFLLKEKDTAKTIELFYVWCRQKYSQNSCRALVNPIIQYCKYNGIDPKIRESYHMYHTTPTVRDHILIVDQAREMYKVASLENKVMVKTWLLGLRISDACTLESKPFTFQQISEEPIEVLVTCKKENTIAHCFIDREFQELLRKHVPTLDKNNKFLFQSTRHENLTEKQLLRRLQNLQKEAGIEPRGVFGWHIARKLFLRTATELGVSSWAGQMMVGKALDASIATYIQGANLKKEAMKILNVLRMEEPKSNGRVADMEKELEELRTVMKVLAKYVNILKQTVAYKRGAKDFIEEVEEDEILKKFLEGAK